MTMGATPRTLSATLACLFRMSLGTGELAETFSWGGKAKALYWLDYRDGASFEGTSSPGTSIS